MRDYGKISITIWHSEKFRALPNDNARLLYFYLHTCRHVNSVGCFVLPVGYIMADMRWSEQAVRQGVESLCRGSLIAWDEAHETVRICKYLEFDPFTNDSHATGGLKLALQLPDGPEKLVVLEELAAGKWGKTAEKARDAVEGLRAKLSRATPSTTPCATPSPQGVRPEPEPEPEPEPINLSTSQADAFEADFEQFWQAYPRRDGKGQARRAFKASRQKIDFAALMAGVERYKRHKPGFQDWAMPATWLNGERWSDELAPSVSRSEKTSAGPKAPPLVVLGQ